MKHPQADNGCPDWLILASFVGFSIAMLVLADKATPAFVFKTVFNNTGYDIFASQTCLC